MKTHSTNNSLRYNAQIDLSSVSCYNSSPQVNIFSKRRYSAQPKYHNPSSSSGKWILENSPILGKFYPKQLQRKEIIYLNRPKTVRENRCPFSTSKSISDNFAVHIIRDSTPTFPKRNSEFSQNFYPDSRKNSLVTENVIKSYKFITSIEDKNRDSFIKPKMPNIMKNAVILAKQKLTDIIKKKARPITKSSEKVNYSTSEKVHNVVKTLEKQRVVIESVKKINEIKNLQNSPKTFPEKQSSILLKNNEIFQIIHNPKSKICTYSNARKSVNLSRPLNSLSILHTDFKNDEIEHVKNIRKSRLTQIYENVLYKAGENNARFLYKDYFEDKVGIIDINALENKMIAQKISEDVAHPIKIVESLKNAENSRNQLIKKFPTAGERRIKIKNYGKWYLKPNDFSISNK